MKSLFIAIISISGMALVSTGCATKNYGTVLPKADGTYQIVTKAKYEKDAMKMAEKDAETTCKKREKTKHFVVIDHSSEYVGPKVESNGGVAGVAASTLQFLGQKNNKENYKVDMTVKCDT